MYPRPKKTALGWMIDIFVGLSVIVLIGVIAYGVHIAKDGPRSKFGGSASSNSPLQLGK